MRPGELHVSLEQPPELLEGDGVGPLGRHQELAILEDALARAGEGERQIIGVAGEAGAGKSRLCEEFCASVAQRGITVRRTAGVSHGLTVPLLPVLSLIRDYFEIDDSMTPAEVRAKVGNRILELAPGVADAGTRRSVLSQTKSSLL